VRVLFSTRRRPGVPHEDPKTMLKDNPVMKKLVETGEERIGKIAQQLLSNEKFVATVQGIVSRSLAAKGTLDTALRSALSAMNLPSTADVEQLRSKVDDLEKLLASVEGKIDSLVNDKKKK
jgi:polyhydroxyalkanoate synthesis regulator phasin